MDAYILSTVINMCMENMYTNVRIVVVSGDSEKKLVGGRVS